MKVNLSSAIIVPITILVCAGGVYAYIRFESSNNPAPDSLLDARTLTSTSSSTKSNTNLQQNGSDTLGVTSAGTIPLTQQGGTSSSSNQNTQNSIPGPEDFEQYDKYKDEPNSLYATLKQGSGEAAKQGDFVAVIYKGWLTDGTLFDQTKKNEQGQLQAFGLTLGQGQVIRGWEETIPGMKVGETRRLIIPGAAGYGTNGQGVIPPNALLVFDVELVQIGETPATP